LLEPLARARLSVRANVGPCIQPALHPYQAVVRRWLDGLEWAHGLVVHRVLVVCSVVLPPVLRLLEPLRAPAPEQAHLHAVLASVIRGHAVSRKAQ